MSIKRISPEEAQAALASAETWTYLDVRTSEEFAAGHVEGAVNIPIAYRSGFGMVANPDFLAQADDQLGRNTKLIVGCKRGGRSLRAAQLLLANGYSEVVDMRGGMDGELDRMGQMVYPGWIPRGLPVVL